MASIFANLSIPMKLGLQALGIAAVAIAVAAMADEGLGRLSGIVDDLASRDARRARLALEAESLFNSAAINEKNAILYRDEAMRQAQIAAYDESIAKVSSLLDDMAPLIETQEARELVVTFRRAVEERRRASHRVFELAEAGKTDEAFDYSVRVAAKSRQVAIKAVDGLVIGSRASLEAVQQGAEAIATQTQSLVVLWSAAGFGIIVLISYLLTMIFIVRPLTRITDSLVRIAIGDPDVQIEGTGRRDEIGALARSVEGIRARVRS